MKPSLLLLHGALGATGQFIELKEKLQPYFEVHAFNFSGHGGNDLPEKFTIELFVQDTISFLHKQGFATTDIFGYSMGGYVALSLAKEFPESVNRILTLGTKFNWTKESAERETKMLVPGVIEQKVPKFATALQQRHSPQDWKKIMTLTAQMMLELGDGLALSTVDFQEIENRTLICVGSEDNMVTIEESENVAGQLPNGNFKMVEGFKHPIEAVDKEVLAGLIREFMLGT